MDLITLAMAKKYTDEKAGYSEKPVLTFNGNFTGKPLADGKFVKISDTPMDLNGMQKAIATVHPDFVDIFGVATMEITKEQFTIQEADNGQYAIMDNNVFVFSVTEAGGDFSVGIYVLAQVEDGTPVMWISRIEFAETIHTIDPKFIPGVVLPVVELSTAVGEALTEAENAKLNEVAATGLPCVICFTMEGMQMSAVFSFTDMGGLPMYSHTFGTMFIQIVSDGTAWSANAETV